MTEIIIKLYREGKSPYEISEILSKTGLTCYPNKVRRTLKKNGILPRDRSAAQELALKTGRSKSPTGGKPLPKVVKDKIGDTLSKRHKKLPQAEKEKKSLISKQTYNKLTEEQKRSLHDKANKSLRKTVELGSRLEKFLLVKLRQNGYEINFHSRLLLPTVKLQVDLFLPSIKTAIEVDGKSHFQPIWGEEHFNKVKAADKRKNSFLIQNGYNIVRIKAVASKTTPAYCRLIYQLLTEELEKICPEQDVEKRLIWVDPEAVKI